MCKNTARIICYVFVNDFSIYPRIYNYVFYDIVRILSSIMQVTDRGNILGILDDFLFNLFSVVPQLVVLVLTNESQGALCTMLLSKIIKRVFSSTVLEALKLYSLNLFLYNLPVAQKISYYPPPLSINLQWNLQNVFC